MTIQTSAAEEYDLCIGGFDDPFSLAKADNKDAETTYLSRAKPSHCRSFSHEGELDEEALQQIPIGMYAQDSLTTHIRRSPFIATDSETVGGL